MVMERFWLAFIPLFVAFDVLGLLPVYGSLAQGLPSPQRRLAVHNAILVAFCVALVFLLVSELAFQALGIQMGDLLIAGGVILFVLALNDLLRPEKSRSDFQDSVQDMLRMSRGPEKTPYASADAIGVVPLGVPLIVGPAVLTTALLTRQRYGIWPTVGAISLNVLLTWLVLQGANWLMGRLGRNGARVISKVSSLVLAAFAVMLVRQGLAMWFAPPPPTD